MDTASFGCYWTFWTFFFVATFGHVWPFFLAILGAFLSILIIFGHPPTFSNFCSFVAILHGVDTTHPQTRIPRGLDVSTASRNVRRLSPGHRVNSRAGLGQGGAPQRRRGAGGGGGALQEHGGGGLPVPLLLLGLLPRRVALRAEERLDLRVERPQGGGGWGGEL